MASEGTRHTSGTDEQAGKNHSYVIHTYINEHNILKKGHFCRLSEDSELSKIYTLETGMWWWQSSRNCNDTVPPLFCP